MQVKSVFYVICIDKIYFLLYYMFKEQRMTDEILKEGKDLKEEIECLEQRIKKIRRILFSLEK